MTEVKQSGMAPGRSGMAAGPQGAPGRQGIEIEVLLFAGAREAAGVARTAVILPVSATAGDLLDLLITEYPALGAHRGSLRLAVNSEYARADHPLQTGDQVALIPPTCGG
jgi:molybdopterin converting factor subunit 1